MNEPRDWSYRDAVAEAENRRIMAFANRLEEAQAAMPTAVECVEAWTWAASQLPTVDEVVETWRTHPSVVAWTTDTALDLVLIEREQMRRMVWWRRCLRRLSDRIRL